LLLALEYAYPILQPVGALLGLGEGRRVGTLEGIGVGLKKSGKAVGFALAEGAMVGEADVHVVAPARDENPEGHAVTPPAPIVTATPDPEVVVGIEPAGEI